MAGTAANQKQSQILPAEQAASTAVTSTRLGWTPEGSSIFLQQLQLQPQRWCDAFPNSARSSLGARGAAPAPRELAMWDFAAQQRDSSDRYFQHSQNTANTPGCSKQGRTHESLTSGAREERVRSNSCEQSMCGSGRWRSALAAASEQEVLHKPVRNSKRTFPSGVLGERAHQEPGKASSRNHPLCS